MVEFHRQFGAARLGKTAKEVERMGRILKGTNELGQKVFEDTYLIATIKVRLVKDWTQLRKGDETGKDIMFLCDIDNRMQGGSTGFSEHFKPGNTGVQRKAVLRRLCRNIAENL